MKAILVLLVLIVTNAPWIQGQSIVGKWQLVSSTSCLDDEIETTEEEDELVADMQSRNTGTASVMEFKANNMGTENLRIMDSRKSSKSSSFMYKIEDGVLYLLDKKSRLLKGSYDIEKLTSDSLIFSNAARACETWVLVRIP